jgi:hypothetical protein
MHRFILAGFKEPVAQAGVEIAQTLVRRPDGGEFLGMPLGRELPH